MFLVILLFLVLCSLSLKEGLDAEDKVSDIYNNYVLIDETLKVFKEKFNSLAN